MGGARVRRGEAVGRVTRFRVLVVALVVVLIAGGGFGAYKLGYLDDLLDDSEPDSALDVAPPEALEFPEARAAQPVLDGATPGALDPKAIEQAVIPVIDKHKFGPHLGVATSGLRADRPTWAHGSGTFTPASTLKLFTTLAALESIGPDHRFSTTVLRDPDSAGGPQAPAEIVLVGGGDPLLARSPVEDPASTYPVPASLGELLDDTAAELKADGVTQVRVRYDASLFTGPDASPTWEPGYIGDVTTPVSALWVDEGIVDPDTEQRTEDPAGAAAEDFADGLRSRGVKVVQEPRPGEAADAAEEVASVDSPTVAQIVQYVLEHSDNEGAEVLLRQIAISEGREASFTGGAEAIESVLTELGVPWQGVELYDGSGLSRDNRVTLDAMLGVLQAAVEPSDPGARGVVTDLPVAGFSGTLLDRFVTAESSAGLGYVRVKTGTLTGVHAFAGMTTDADGRPILFAALSDKVNPENTLDARAGLDEIGAALAACSCGA